LYLANLLFRKLREKFVVGEQPPIGVINFYVYKSYMQRSCFPGVSCQDILIYSHLLACAYRFIFQDVIYSMCSSSSTNSLHSLCVDHMRFRALLKLPGCKDFLRPGMMAMNSLVSQGISIQCNVYYSCRLGQRAQQALMAPIMIFSRVQNNRDKFLDRMQKIHMSQVP